MVSGLGPRDSKGVLQQPIQGRYTNLGNHNPVYVSINGQGPQEMLQLTGPCLKVQHRIFYSSHFVSNI